MSLYRNGKAGKKDCQIILGDPGSPCPVNRHKCSLDYPFFAIIKSTATYLMKGEKDMVISRLTCGKGKQAHERYFLMEGDIHIAWFDDLETAAKVNRFIKGAHL